MAEEEQTKSEQKAQELPSQSSLVAGKEGPLEKDQDEEEVSAQEKFEKKSVKKKIFSSAVFVGIVNLLGAGLLFFVLSLLPGKAGELKSLRNTSELSRVENKIDKSDLEVSSNKEKFTKLEELYPDELGLINFVQEVEKLKQDGTITRFSFANQKAVRDKTRVLGIPIVLEFRGSWEEIDADLQSIQKMPYLIRGITFDARVGEDGQVSIIYGGFIYVSEEFEKN